MYEPGAGRAFHEGRATMAAPTFIPGSGAASSYAAMRPSSQADHAIGGKHDKLDAGHAAHAIRLDDHGNRLDGHDGTLAAHDGQLGAHDDRLDRHRADINSNMDRLDALERAGAGHPAPDSDGDGHDGDS